MKIELAKLHTENAKLEEQLSATKLKTVESFRDRHRYVSQVIHLQNEREIILKDIQQLELSSVGDSKLLPESQLEDILNSLSRISKCLEAKNSKSNTLEQTIVKVQTSSQLLLSKADEAQKILEKEKQKIINEKEEAIADKLNMEKQLGDLKQLLETQKNQDKVVIKNLEAEILNQKLIIDKINQSRQKYISKLEEEMRNLQDMYNNSIENVSDLQKQINNLSQENNKNVQLIESIKKSLKEKSDEVLSLRRTIEDLKNKPSNNAEVQADFSQKYKKVLTQTDKENNFEYDRFEEPFIAMSANVNDSKDALPDLNIIKIKMPQQQNSNIISDLMPKQKSKSINEVQILTANVEPTLDFVKNSYLNYKLKCLSVGRIEHYSIMSQNYNDKESQKSGKTFTDSSPRNPHLVDLYNRKSVQSDSSKVDNLGIEHTITTEQDPQSATKSSGFTGYELVNDIFEFDSNENSNKDRDSNIFIASTSDKSADNDLFLIYKDSESNHVNKDLDDKGEWQKTSRQPDIFVETIAMHPISKIKDTQHVKTKNNNVIIPDDEIYHEAKETYYEDRNLKQIINIELPRVENDSYSILTVSDGDKKSIDSYTLAIYPKSKFDEHLRKNTESKDQGPRQHDSQEKFKHLTDSNKDSNPPLKNKNFKDKQIKNDHKLTEDKSKSAGKGSHHKLSRVDANFVLLRSQQRKSDIDANNDNLFKMQEPGTFGLKYILDTVQREVDPDNDSNKSARKTRSDELINMQTFRGANNSSSLKYSPEIVSSCEYKSVTEQSIMVKIDNTEDLEHQVRNLTKALQNIEKDYKKKIEAIKVQYDSNIKSMINEHNQGVKSIQSLHEETLQDVIKIHENEVESLRSMSIEAMRKAEKLEKENRLLKSKVQASCTCSVEVCYLYYRNS